MDHPRLNVRFARTLDQCDVVGFCGDTCGKLLDMARTCEICDVSIEHRQSTAKYCSRRCANKSPSTQRAKARYAKSPQGKAVLRKYRISEKGAEANRRATARYQQTENGKEKAKLYRQSVQDSAAQKRATDRSKQRAENQDSASEHDISIERDLASQL